MIGKRETSEYGPESRGQPRYGFQCVDCGSSGWKDHAGSMVSQWVADKNCLARMGYQPFEAGVYEDAWSERIFAQRRAEAAAIAQDNRVEWWAWYDRYLNSGAWQAKRAEVLHRDGGRCVHCASLATQVHHVSYERVGYELLTDLQAVCCACHADIHDRGQAA